MPGGMPNLEQVFALIDKDKLGYITAAQLTALMQQHGMSHNEQEVQDMINVVDTSGTGLMDATAFSAAMDICLALTTNSNTQTQNADPENNEVEQNESDEENAEETDLEDDNEMDDEEEEATDDDISE